MGIVTFKMGIIPMPISMWLLFPIWNWICNPDHDEKVSL